MEAGFNTFKLDLDREVSNTKAIVRKRGEKVVLPDSYPTYDIEFYDIVKTCASHIDKVKDYDKKCELHKELSKIFITRHKAKALMFLKDLSAYFN